GGGPREVDAEGGNRTHTLLPGPDFESGASASSATSAALAACCAPMVASAGRLANPSLAYLTPRPGVLQYRAHTDAGWSSWQLARLITSRSQVRVLSPLSLGRLQTRPEPWLTRKADACTRRLLRFLRTAWQEFTNAARNV